MSTNAELARIFHEMAAVLELTGADRFRVAAHARVARTLKDLTVDVATLVDDLPALKALEGVGDASAKKIVEYVRTGVVAEHESLLDEIPEGLLDVLDIPGLGPKTVKLLWEQADVTNVDSLREAIESGALEGLPRMGAKTIENIRESIRFAEKAGERARLGDALPVAEQIVAALAKVAGTKDVCYAGSLRRGRETIGDIDVLAATSRPDALAEAFRTMEGVEKVLAAGESKSSVRLERGLQVDLRIVPVASFGSALLYFTGSKQHNVRLRERAIRRTMRLNEYGLFPDDGNPEPPQKRGVAPIASKREEDLYDALDLPYIPPELREDHGELTADLPVLIELGHVRADLHVHTVASDGKMTIEQVGREAKARGYHTVAVTDHSKASAQAGGLSEDEMRRHVAAVRAVDVSMSGITILAGAEVDVLADGHLDYDDDLLAELDLVVASPHVALHQDATTATKRLVRAASHPLVHVLGHPTGRLINRRPGLAPDIAAVAEAAAAHDTALEINANSYRLDLRDVHVRAALEAGALLSINTDAHGPGDFDQMRYGVMTARRGWLTADRCINAWSAERLRRWRRREG